MTTRLGRTPLNGGLARTFVCVVLVASCVPASPEPGKLQFRSGFEEGVEIGAGPGPVRLQGLDSSTGFAWEDLARSPGIRDHRYTFLIGPHSPRETYLSTRILTTTGHGQRLSRVLRHQLKADDPDYPGTSRVEYSLYYDEREPEHAFKEGYVRYRMRLPPELGSLLSKEESLPWFMLSEWKESRVAGEGGGAGRHNYRINIQIRKDRGSPRLHWFAHAQQVSPTRVSEWKLRNRAVPVPLGRWVEVALYLKKHPVDGRVYFSIDGKTVFDRIGRTQHESNPRPLQFWSFFKLYTSASILRRYQEEFGRPLSIDYDDLELWSGFPP